MPDVPAAPAAPAAPASAPAPAPAPASSAAVAATPSAASPPSPPTAPAAPAAPVPAAASPKPTWLREAWWNPEAATINFTSLQQFEEEQAALAARKPEDIKLPTKLPDTVKLPEGTTYKIDDKDPYAAGLRQVAAEKRFTQEQIEALVVMDAQLKAERYTADRAYVAEENKKLGENAQVRKDAVVNYIAAMPGLEEGERIALSRGDPTKAAYITGLEKLIGKAIGTIPASSAAGLPAPPTAAKPPEKTLAQRMYPNMPSSANPQQKAS